MSIVGIDLSSRAIDLCTLPEDSNDAEHFRVRIDLPSGASPTERIRRLRDRMPARTAWADAGVSLLAIELPFSRTPNPAMLFVYGGLLQLVPASLSLLELRSDDWRPHCLIPIRKPRDADSDWHKHRALEFARELWTNPPETLDHNAAESFCIAYAAREIDLRVEKGAAAA
jgi:hypothetical protein